MKMKRRFLTLTGEAMIVRCGGYIPAQPMPAPDTPPIPALDYSHKRFCALPYADAARAIFAKDRLGLGLTKEETEFAVEFVAPNSPAEAAGFEVGDKVTIVEGKSTQTCLGTSFTDLKYGASGTNFAVTMQGGGTGQVKLADYC